VFGNVDLGGDVVIRGAFAATLAEHEANGTTPQMFWMHNPGAVPGRWDAMSEDDKGLAVTGTLANTPLGNEVRELAKMKAVRGLSIGYWPTDVDYSDDGVRVIKSLDLVEVSIVSLAMNPLAEIEATKARLSASGEYVPTRREFEHKLRDAGLSRALAKRLLAAAFAGPQRDADDLEDEGIREMIDLAAGLSTRIDVATVKSLTRGIT
jgi:HK97 family phage prohead protease